MSWVLLLFMWESNGRYTSQQITNIISFEECDSIYKALKNQYGNNLEGTCIRIRK